MHAGAYVRGCCTGLGLNLQESLESHPARSRAAAKAQQHDHGVPGLRHKVAYRAIAATCPGAQDAEGQRSGRQHGWLQNGWHKAALWPLSFADTVGDLSLGGRMSCPLMAHYSHHAILAVLAITPSSPSPLKS